MGGEKGRGAPVVRPPVSGQRPVRARLRQARTTLGSKVHHDDSGNGIVGEAVSLTVVIHSDPDAVGAGHRPALPWPAVFLYFQEPALGIPSIGWRLVTVIPYPFAPGKGSPPP